MQKNEYFQIRRKHVLYLLIILALFVGGFYLPKLVSKINVDLFAKQPSEEIVKNCEKFCFLANTEYAFVKDNSCYCNQRQLVYDQNRNETIIVVQSVSAGIIKNITVEKGLTPEALQLLQRQQLLENQQIRSLGQK